MQVAQLEERLAELDEEREELAKSCTDAFETLSDVTQLLELECC